MAYFAMLDFYRLPLFGLLSPYYNVSLHLSTQCIQISSNLE